MSYSNQYFGKELTDLSYEDILHFFIEEREESDKIEFKSNGPSSDKNSKERINGIIRTTCGLLNSEGGIIIWGAPVGQKVSGRKEKIFKGELTPVNDKLEKDSFITKITDLITPSPRGVKFQSIQISDQYIYIIEVEQSPYSPHQFNNTYYMRIDGQTRPAPHHYIEALFRKVTFPNLEGYLAINAYEDHGNYFRLQISAVFLNLSALQNEHEFHYEIRLSGGVFMGHGPYPNLDYVYGSDGKDVKSHKNKPTLFFNDPVIVLKNIDFDKNEIKLANYNSDIILLFGGKKAPLKMSVYKLALNYPPPENLNDMIVSTNENIYTYDTKMKAKDTLENALGRKLS